MGTFSDRSRFGMEAFGTTDGEGVVVTFFAAVSFFVEEEDSGAADE